MSSGSVRKHIVTICIIWVVLSVVGELAIFYGLSDFPGRASAEGVVTSDAFLVLLRIATPVLVLVALIIVYAAVRFRVSDDDTQSSPHQYRSSHAFPWTWVSISTVLNVLFIFYPGIAGLESLWSMAAAATDPIVVHVTAEQWDWRFDYPAQKLTGETQLVVPVGKPVRFVLETKDVMHSFWIPAWGIKKAVLPGETRVLVVTPDQILDTESDPLARVQCSQICGAGHADMQSVLRVVSSADFAGWVAQEREAAKEEMDDMKMDMGGSGDMKMDMGGSGGMKMDMGGSDGAKMDMNSDGGMKMDDAGGGMKMDMGGSGGMKMDEKKPATGDN